MSILKDGTIKFNCDMCFTNYVDLPGIDEKISVAPDQSAYNVWAGPEYLQFFKDRARKTIDGLYGQEVANVPIDAYRMCW